MMPPRERAIRALRRHGATIGQIAALLEMCEDDVRRRLDQRVDEALCGTAMLKMARAEGHRPGLPRSPSQPRADQRRASARRERVWSCWDQGMNRAQIASELGLSKSTVINDLSQRPGKPSRGAKARPNIGEFA